MCFSFDIYVCSLIGVWTKENIPTHTKFGPLVGKITPESEKKEDTAYCFPGWKVC